MNEYKTASLVARDSAFLAFADEQKDYRGGIGFVLDEGDKLGASQFGKKLEELTTFLSSKSIGRNPPFELASPIVVLLTNLWGELADGFYAALAGAPLEYVADEMCK